MSNIIKAMEALNHPGTEKGITTAELAQLVSCSLIIAESAILVHNMDRDRADTPKTKSRESINQDAKDKVSDLIDEISEAEKAMMFKVIDLGIAEVPKRVNPMIRGLQAKLEDAKGLLELAKFADVLKKM